MSNSYMWAQTACDIPEGPADAAYSQSKPQSAQMPRSYQSESYNGQDNQSSYTQASGSPPSYGAQSRSSSYTHNQQQPSNNEQHQPSQHREQPSRQTSYSNGNSYQEQQPSPRREQTSRQPSYNNGGSNHQEQQSSYQQQQPSRQASYNNSSSSNGHSSGSSDFIEQSVSMQDLIRENFGGQGSSSGSLQLSPTLLEHIQHVPQGGDSKLYYLEPQNGGKSMSGMMYPSSDLALVNQLAVKHHRHACMKVIDGSGPEQNEKVLRGTEWSMLNEERVELTTSLTVGGGQRITVSTTVQELSLFRRK